MGVKKIFAQKTVQACVLADSVGVILAWFNPSRINSQSLSKSRILRDEGRGREGRCKTVTNQHTCSKCLIEYRIRKWAWEQVGEYSIEEQVPPPNILGSKHQDGTCHGSYPSDLKWRHLLRRDEAQNRPTRALAGVCRPIGISPPWAQGKSGASAWRSLDPFKPTVPSKPLHHDHRFLHMYWNSCAYDRLECTCYLGGCAPVS